MTDQEILDNAPDGATHFDKIQYYRIGYSEPSLHIRYDVFNQGSGNWDGVGDMYLTDTYKIRSLADIRTIVEQAERIAELEEENHEIKTKLSDYASQLWVLQELRDRASNMDTDSFVDTTSVKMYAKGIHIPSN